MPFSMTPFPPQDRSQRWMMFVDGENFAIRGAAVAKAEGIELEQGRFFTPNMVYVAFFQHPEAGNLDAIWRECDKFFDLTQHLCERWRDYSKGERVPAGEVSQE